MTESAIRRASRTILKWPSCSAPIVGTKPIGRCSEYSFKAACRIFADFVMISIIGYVGSGLLSFSSSIVKKIVEARQEVFSEIIGEATRFAITLMQKADYKIQSRGFQPTSDLRRAVGRRKMRH